MAGRARRISLSQRASWAVTRNVVPSILTDVARATAGPTASCQASCVRPLEEGCRRRISAMTPPLKVWIDRMVGVSRKDIQR